MHEHAVEALRRADRVLGKIIHHVGPCRWRRSERDPFEALVKAIIYQQVSVSAAATIYDRFRNLAGGTTTRPSVILRLAPVRMQRAGISRQKRLYLKSLAREVDAGHVPVHRLHRLADNEIVAKLTTIRGIGVWTAQMFLIFHLQRPDVFPTADFGIRQAVRRAYRFHRPPKPWRLERLAETWRPYRSIASWYLWRSVGGPV